MSLIHFHMAIFLESCPSSPHLTKVLSDLAEGCPLIKLWISNLIKKWNRIFWFTQHCPTLTLMEAADLSKLSLILGPHLTHWSLCPEDLYCTVNLLTSFLLKWIHHPGEKKKSHSIFGMVSFGSHFQSRDEEVPLGLALLISHSPITIVPGFTSSNLPSPHSSVHTVHSFCFLLRKHNSVRL